MKHRYLAWIMAVLLLALVPMAALADENDGTTDPSGDAVLENEVTEDSRVTMGADLTEKQRAYVYADFGIEEGSVKEISVNNKEERAYLEGLVPEAKIGTVTLSCVYITLLEEGKGLDVSVNNINYCTEQMYINALKTAGITDAKIMVSAPFPVSGTGALTGIYKAYEDVTGSSLNSIAKQLGAEELITTGQLAEYIGSDEAAALIGELKEILDQTQGMTDDAVRKEIESLASTYNVTLTDAQKEQVLQLVRKLEGKDTGELQDTLVNMANAAQKASDVASKVSKVVSDVRSFISRAVDFFSNLFGK